MRRCGPQHVCMKSAHHCLLVLLFASAALAACGGGSGGAAPPPAGGPPPAPPPPPPAGVARITLHNNTSNADEDSGSIYGRIGDRTFGRAELNTGDILCTFQTGSRTCTVEVPIGQTLTLATQESTEITWGRITGTPAPDWLKRFAQFVGWTGPCSAPEPGVCVLQPSADQTVTALWKPMTVTELATVGGREWRVTIEARPFLGIGPAYTGGPQRYQNGFGFPGGTLSPCLGGPSPSYCAHAVTPDATSVTFEALPPRSAPPAGAGPLLQWRGFGDVCTIAGTSTSCTVSTLGTQRASMKWEYYLCSSAGGSQSPSWGADISWQFGPPVPSNCTLQQP